MAGDPDVIAALKRYRPNVGVAPPEFIQHAAAAAWGDEAHVEDVRALYRAKRDVLLPVFEAAGIYHAGGDATFFLWLDAGERADPLAAALLERGVVRRARLVLRPGRRGLPAARARADARRVRAGGRRCSRQSLACRAALRPAQEPERGIASTAPVCELRRNSSPSAPESSSALTTSPSGSVTRVPPVT